MFYKSLLVCPVIALAACGGSSTGSSVLALSSKGFATVNTPLTGDYEFTIPNVNRIVATGPNDQMLERQTIEMTGTSGVGPVTLVMDGQTYTLERDPNNPSFLEYTDGGSRIIIQTLIRNNDYAVGIEVFSVLDGALNASNLILGYDTDPALVADQTGTASFTGDVRGVLRNGFDDAFGGGTFRMDANFNNNSLSGEATIVDRLDNNANFTFDPVTVTLQTANISGNSFQGGVALKSGNLNGSFVGATYDGRFYGPDGEVIGGQITGRIDLDASTRDTVFEAIYLGNKSAP